MNMKGFVPRSVVIGASAGGVLAISHILKRLPAMISAPVVVVQHVSERSAEAFVSVFQHQSPVPVEEAQDKQRPLPGRVYLAPPGYHLLFELDGSFSLSVDAPVNFSRPSIDVLFESAASCFGSDLLAILLTGANQDGAEGLEAVKKNGGRVIVQDPTTAESAAMPKAALARMRPDQVLHLNEIADSVAGLLEHRELVP